MGRVSNRVRPARRGAAWAAFLAAALLLAARVAGAQEEPLATVTLRPEAVVHGPRILLGDVAEVESDDPELLAALVALDLGRAPLSNQTVYLNEPRLRVALRRAKLPEKRIAIGGVEGNVAIVSAPSLAREPAAGAASSGSPEAQARGAASVEVRRGQRVGLIVRYGAVEIVTTARLVESGRVGELVRVRREGSDQDVWGRLAAPDRVEVDLGAMTGEGEP